MSSILLFLIFIKPCYHRLQTTTSCILFLMDQAWIWIWKNEPIPLSKNFNNTFLHHTKACHQCFKIHIKVFSIINLVCGPMLCMAVQGLTFIFSVHWYWFSLWVSQNLKFLETISMYCTILNCLAVMDHIQNYFPNFLGISEIINNIKKVMWAK